MDILIRKERNNQILINKDSVEFFEVLKMDKPPYNFKKITIDNKYADCECVDFNEDLTFNIDKCNKRKQKIENINTINALKQKLKDTDYIALKAFEGSISEEEFEPVKKQREEWRKEVDSLLKTI